MASSTYWRAVAMAKARRYGLDPQVFARQIQMESGFNPSARSPAGALGIAQIMPATARGWNVNPMNPNAALDAAARNMARYVHSYGGRYDLALAAYNAGPGAVAKYHGVPPYAETRRYVQSILHGHSPQSGASSGASGGRRVPQLRSTIGAPSGYSPPQLHPVTVTPTTLQLPTPQDALAQFLPQQAQQQAYDVPETQDLLANVQAIRNRLLGGVV